jgi:hypothetical protein
MRTATTTSAGARALDTPAMVHDALMDLSDASPEEYLRVAFTDLSTWEYDEDQAVSAYQITKIVNVLDHRVPLRDLLTMHARLSSVRSSSLADGFTQELIAMKMAKDATATLRTVIDLLPELTWRHASFLLHDIGCASPTSSLHTLLRLPLASELTPEQHATLFGENEELNRPGHAYRATRGYYMRSLVYRAYPDGAPEQAIGLMLAPEWHGDSESLIDTAATLSRATP